MLFALVFLFLTALFLTALLLAGRTGEEEKRMLARFAAVRSSGARGLSVVGPGGLLKEAAPEMSHWIEPLLTRVSLFLRLDLLLLQADSQSTIKQFVLTSAAAAVIAAFLALLFLPIPLLALPAGALGSYIPMLILKFRRQRRIAAFDKALPDVIEMMSRSLRAGHSVVAAIGIVAEQAAEPARTEFGEVFRKQNFGLPMRDCLMQLLDRVPSQDLRVLVTGIVVQKDTGGNLVQILDRTSAVIRERLKLQGDIRVHTAQGRMTGWILCALPIVMLVLINLINPGYSRELTDDPLGRKFLYTGIVLLIAGALIIRRIVSSIEV